MATTIHNSLIPQTMYEFAGKSPSSTWGGWIKNVLVGRFCENWKDKALVAGVVYYVAKAALSFFTASWTVAIIELFTGAFLAMLRREIRDFTNLHKATGTLHNENDRFRLSNLQLRQTIGELHGKFEKSIASFNQKLTVMGEQNNLYSLNNATFKGQLEAMERTLEEANKHLDRNGKVNGEVLEKTLENIRIQKRTFETMENGVAEANSTLRETIAEWRSIVRDVAQMDILNAKLIGDLREQANELKSGIASDQKVREELKKEIERLTTQADRITHSTDRLEGVSARLDTQTSRGSGWRFPSFTLLS